MTVGKPRCLLFINSQILTFIDRALRPESRYRETAPGVYLRTNAVPESSFFSVAGLTTIRIRYTLLLFFFLPSFYIVREGKKISLLRGLKSNGTKTPLTTHSFFFVLKLNNSFTFIRTFFPAPYIPLNCMSASIKLPLLLHQA